MLAKPKYNKTQYCDYDWSICTCLILIRHAHHLQQKTQQSTTNTAKEIIHDVLDGEQQPVDYAVQALQETDKGQDERRKVNQNAA